MLLRLYIHPGTYFQFLSVLVLIILFYSAPLDFNIFISFFYDSNLSFYYIYILVFWSYQFLLVFLSLWILCLSSSIFLLIALNVFPSLKFFQNTPYLMIYIYEYSRFRLKRIGHFGCIQQLLFLCIEISLRRFDIKRHHQ